MTRADPPFGPGPDEGKDFAEPERAVCVSVPGADAQAREGVFDRVTRAAMRFLGVLFQMAGIMLILPGFAVLGCGIWLTGRGATGRRKP